MKNYILVFISSFTILVQSCGNSDNEMPIGDCLTILIDRTDDFKATKKLSENDFLPLLQIMSTNPLASAKVRLTPITNIRYEKAYFLSIPVTSSYSMNELERKELINDFKKQLRAYLHEINSAPVGKEQSAIFENVSLELDELAQCNTGSVKTMVIISDLLQNTTWFNAYKKNGLNAYINDPKKFHEAWEKNCPIKANIKGITIYLIHQPTSVVEDNQFYQLSSLVKEFLEQKGANVHISASLK